MTLGSDPTADRARLGFSNKGGLVSCTMETMSGPRMLMCPPDYFGIEYEINPWMNVQFGSDAERSRRQWNALEEALEDLGVSVELIEPVAGLPDLVFTANVGSCLPESLYRFTVSVRRSAGGGAPILKPGRGAGVSRLCVCPRATISKGPATPCSAATRYSPATDSEATCAAINGSATGSDWRFCHSS